MTPEGYWYHERVSFLYCHWQKTSSLATQSMKRWVKLAFPHSVFKASRKFGLMKLSGLTKFITTEVDKSRYNAIIETNWSGLIDSIPTFYVALSRNRLPLLASGTFVNTIVSCRLALRWRLCHWLRILSTWALWQSMRDQRSKSLWFLSSSPRRNHIK